MAFEEQLSFRFDAPAELLTPDDIYHFTVGDLLTGALKEDRRVERKPARIQAKQLGEYFSMWANTSPDGGLLVVGIEDNGTLQGLSHIGHSRLNEIEKAGAIYCPDARFKSKRVPVTLPGGKESFVVLIRVYWREDRVVRTASGDAFVRIGDEKRKLSEDDIRELAIDKGEMDHEREPTHLHYPDEFDMDLVRRFTDRYRHHRNAPELTDLKILELMHLGKVHNRKFAANVACALLFSKDPVDLFPGCKIRFLRFQGEDEGTGADYNVVKSEFIEGPIPYLIGECARLLEGQLRQFSKLGDDGHFITMEEYPRAAWMEALVNACVHRSYGLKNMNIIIKMFDNRLVIESPGGFPPLVTPSNIFDMHAPRNPRLMHALYYMDLVREHSEGTKRMRKTMADMQLPPPDFRQVASGAGHGTVRVTLKNNQNKRKLWVDSDVSAILGEKVADLSTNERLVLNYVAANGSINVSQCLQVASCSKWHTAKRLLMRLVSKGFLVHHHSTKVVRDPYACYTFPNVARPPIVHWTERRRR